MMLKLLCSTWRHYSVFIFKCGTNKNYSQMLSALINLSEVRCSAVNLDADYYWTVYVVCVGDDEEELSDGRHHSNVDECWFCDFVYFPRCHILTRERFGVEFYNHHYK